MPIRRVLRALGLEPNRPPPQEHTFLSELRRHVTRLGEDRLEYLAAFAGQLARVAYADSTISDAEKTSIARLLRDHGELTQSEARLVVDLVRHEAETLTGMHHHLLNRAINAHASSAEKEHLIDCLYAVASADHLVSNVEDQEVRRIAGALLVPHKIFVAIRARYKDQLEVMRLMKRRNPSRHA